MNAIRSIFFNIFFFVGSFILSISLLSLLFLPRKKLVPAIATIYGSYMCWIQDHILGLKLEIRGLENIPADGHFIIAAKHQSAYETLQLPFMKSLHYPAIILKKELTRLPVWGWYPARMGLIAIDRGSGMESLQSIIRGCRRAKDEKRPVVIFPQGTRVAVGAKKPYKVGLAKVYRDLNSPVIPMALNSGVFWGRNSFFKKSGTVVFEFLPAIEPGLPPLKMMEELEQKLESASDRLVAEALSS